MSHQLARPTVLRSLSATSPGSPGMDLATCWRTGLENGFGVCEPLKSLYKTGSPKQPILVGPATFSTCVLNRGCRFAQGKHVGFLRRPAPRKGFLPGWVLLEAHCSPTYLLLCKCDTHRSLSLTYPWVKERCLDL